ncbi:gamma-glutamyl kinase [Oceanicola sp. 502str15]|uniref:gamma-glutamyl kinase n=1 Tax=Oceanicola sp. 502str15 TaxID=2696061 RepID=UPI002094D9F8|nr:gamma-glutamyl kinase [Oceanicola sp. 502str15]MCO6382310.1 gamma-glutamyl kinase [Oceanicola sp. 502str15]
MLVFWDARLVLLATPKTGTHALESALGNEADIAFRHPPFVKHMGFAWVNRLMPRIVGEKEWPSFRTVAVMREPLDWLGSWYRYRRRNDLVGQNNSTRDMDFSTFLKGYLKDSQPAYSRLGRQWKFLRRDDGRVGIDYLFPYERFDTLVDFLENRLDREIKLEQENVSPEAPLEVDPGLAAPLAKALEKDFRLYDALISGGDWKNI